MYINYLNNKIKKTFKTSDLLLLLKYSNRRTGIICINESVCRGKFQPALYYNMSIKFLLKNNYL